MRLIVGERRQQVLAMRAGSKPNGKALNVAKEMERVKSYFEHWKLKYADKIETMGEAACRHPHCGACTARSAVHMNMLGLTKS